MTTFALRLPGNPKRFVIVDAESLAAALTIANAPDGTTGNGVPSYAAELMIQHRIATRRRQVPHCSGDDSDEHADNCELVEEGDLA